MPIRLHINVDHVATLRNARGTLYPDPVRAAEECLSAGAEGITAHLREDRRHIVDDDIRRLREAVGGRTFNLEMAAVGEMIAIAERIKPDVCTLVPERRQERTTEGGLDVVGGGAALAAHVRRLGDAGIKVSLFVTADAAQIEGAASVRAVQVELHTGEYAHAPRGTARVQSELERLSAASQLARRLGLEVAAGHGLTQGNVPALVAAVDVVELNIGHAVVADAVFVGIGEATRAYRAAIARGEASKGRGR